MIFKRWSGWSKYYRCWIIPAGKTCRSLNLTKRFPFTHYNIPWLHLILTVMIPYMKYYTSIPNQLPFVEKNFPYWKMSLQNLGQECRDCLCRRVIYEKKIRLKFWFMPWTYIFVGMYQILIFGQKIFLSRGNFIQPVCWPIPR